MRRQAESSGIEATLRSLGIGRLFNEIRDAVIVSDATSTVVLWNRAAEEMFGWTVEEARGMPLERLMPPEYRARHRRGFAEWRESGRGRLIDSGHPVEMPAVRADGTRIYVELSLSSFADDAGERYALAILRDVTARRNLTEALQASERLTHTFLEGLPVAVVVRDATGRAVFVNSLARELLGGDVSAAPGLFPEGALYLRGTEARYPFDSLPGARAQRGEREVVANDIDLRRADGTVVPLDTWANPILDDAGRVAYTVVAFRDVRDRVALERRLDRQREELARKNSALSEANEALEAFSYGVSHDLKEPLRAIESYGRALEEDHGEGLEADARDLLRKSREATARTQGLVRGLLDFARATRGELATEPVGIAEVLRSAECVARYEHLFRERNARLSLAIDSERVLATFPALAQVLGNLLTNAVRHNPRPDPVVRVEARRVPERAEIEVVIQDNGPGFPPALRKRHSEDGPRARPEPARGLGLSIATRTVERLGGRLWLVNRPEGGGAAHFTLPAAPEPVPSR